MVELAALQGSPVVLYFYPRDDTSGCTAEAKDFTCLAGEFAGIPAAVLGISPDSPASHRKFTGKHGLGVRLLADGDRTAAEAYGVWVEKSMYGRTYMGVQRATFIIDADGSVAHVIPKASPKTHDDEVLAVLAG